MTVPFCVKTWGYFVEKLFLYIDYVLICIDNICILIHVSSTAVRMKVVSLGQLVGNIQTVIVKSTAMVP